MENLLTMLTNNSGTVNIENNPERGLMSRLEGLYDHIYDLLDLNKGEIGASSSHTVQRTTAESRLLAQSSEHGADR